ncbi:MAG: nucleotidyl transferase AbiEii/AbiGii toxin family protein, partial [Chloroflexi bacterium]|nr:nucleotidyl transferase AbiEii/AbiGii toxin family protein [Chloroflexota bacterium]
MSSLEAATRHILARLAAHAVPAAVVGGLAVSARTEPRFTRDADVCVAIESDAEAEALIRDLRSDGYEVGALVEQESTGRIATVRLDAPDAGGGVIVDLLFASSGIEAEITATAEVIELFEGLDAPVATIGALIALKLLARDDARRPQDRVDLVALCRVASRSDLHEA